MEPLFPNGTSKTFAVQSYDLAATLDSGQAFRWQALETEERIPRSAAAAWTGVIGSHWIRLSVESKSLLAETAEPVSDWTWLTHYLQLDVDLERVLRTFPDDEPMRTAINACRGLRLLRQDPWECLASFILSSTKQIVQIRQIVSLLCERYGKPVSVPSGHQGVFSFPSAERLASLTESNLRGCNMGFRAPYLLATARTIASGQLDLARLGSLPVSDARLELMKLPGVGEKIADCVLLFAYGFQDAFPVDVWVMKALKELYFQSRQVAARRLRDFAASHFGPNAGYAQQYLFHYMRTARKRGE